MAPNDLPLVGHTGGEDSAGVPRESSVPEGHGNRMTPRKDPAEAGVYGEVSAAIERCHDWLCKYSSGIPACTVLLAEPDRRLVLERMRLDPYLMAQFGMPVDEQPGSQCAVVRRFLLECVAAKVLDDRPRELARRLAMPEGATSAASFDDSRTRKALKLLERRKPGVARAIDLVLEEVAARERALAPMAPTFTLGDFDRALREKALGVRDGRLDVKELIEHARQVLGVEPPRTLQEFNNFRSTWVGPFRNAGFKVLETNELLGYPLPVDAPERARAKARIRKAYRRHMCSRWCVKRADSTP
jgi:hypothetical protein